MQNAVILTLDIGTTSCKLVLVDKNGHELFSDKAHCQLYFPKPGQVEQDPQEIWTSIQAMLKCLSRDAGENYDIEAMAISSQISAHFLVDDEGRALTNIISWMDSRRAAQASALVNAFTKAELRHALGMDMLIGPAFIVPKLKWLVTHQPQTLARARYCIQIKDYVIWSLTGEWRSDLTSLKGIVNQQTRRLSSQLLDWAGAPADIIPPFGDPWDIAGYTTAQAASSLNIPVAMPVILGWNDLNAAILGTVGVVRQRSGFDITGTSEHIGFVGPESLTTSPEGINCLPFVDDVMLSYGVTSSGGQAL